MRGCSSFELRREFALFENNLDEPGQLFLLHELSHTIRADTVADLPRVFQALEHASARGLWLAVAASYELGLAFEPRFGPWAQVDRPLLRAWAFHQRTEIPPDMAERWWQANLESLSEQQRQAGVLQLAPEWSAQRHACAVERILALIRNGDCYQVNLTFPLWGLTHGHPFALFARLRHTQAVRYGALIHEGKNWILSRSPELFFERSGNRITTRPMKGTIRRSADAVEDALNLQQLRSSEKDQAENLMIVDLIRNDLGKMAPPGGVRVSSLFDVESYATLFQLTSTIVAEPVCASTQDTLRALFPCGSVTGAPKIRAMEIIREVEEGPRDLYCGGLGWIAPDGRQVFSVPIRTLLVTDDGRCRLDVGSGIVADSDTLAEYAECLAKAEFVRKLADEFQLIETLRWKPDAGLHMLDRHLNRLRTSAASLGFRFERESIVAQLDKATASLAPAVHRVRLSLSRSGQSEIRCSVLDDTPSNPETFVWPVPLDESDPKLRFKTTARKFYDDALQTALDVGCFDVLFANTRGELCEGARSNLFLEIGGKLFTPSLGCGLLPGVLRQFLIEEGLATEAVLRKSDLEAASRIFLGNSLRGLTEVRLRTG